MTTFATQYGENNQSNLDLGIGRLDIFDYVSPVAGLTPGVLEGTAELQMVRTKHPVEAGTPSVVIEVFAIEEKGMMKVDLLESTDPNNFSLLLGQPANLLTINPTPTTVTITNELYTAPVFSTLPVYFRLTHDNLSSFTSLKNAAGTITYTAGTDYAVDLINGIVTILSGSAITTAEALEATYVYNQPLDVQTYGGYFSTRKWSTKFSHQKADGVTWEVSLGYKCIPSLNFTKQYHAKAHNILALEFEMLADPLRNQGDRIAQIRHQTQQPF